MKKVIIILFLFPLFCNGQKDSAVAVITIDRYGTIDSIKSDWLPNFDITVGEGLTLATTSDGMLIITVSKTDTIPVIMLVCDTSKHYVMGWQKDGSNPYYIETTVYWKFGYEVLVGTGEYYNANRSNTLVYIPKELMRHKEYLDENKKPLSKNIIVWQTKNR